MSEEYGKRVLTKLYLIQNDIDAEEFERIFKDAECGWEHLWRQYSTTYRSNLLRFWNYLRTDSILASAFAEWIEEH